MHNYVDLKLTKSNGFYDISFTDGDFTKIAGLDTAILISLSAERRALESEIKEPRNRRGWVGNLINGYDDFEYGSKLWFLDQARATQENLNRAKTWAEDALQWLVDDSIADAIRITTAYNDLLQLIINIEFVRNNDITLSRSYNLWENTFVNSEI